MRVLCVLAQRNEVACLEPWVRYHSYMVGMENIHIIDNASDDPGVLAKLEEYNRLGIGVTRIPPGTDFNLRGRYTADVIANIESEIDFDFVFSMDCDEFLAVFKPDGTPSCRRQDVMNYLTSLKLREGMYQIPGGMENINGAPGRFIWRSHYKKVYFSNRQCLDLDIGYHNGTPRNGLPRYDGQIFYVHYQVRPYNMFRKMARQKLEPFVNPDDPEALRNHKGNNLHLTGLFALSEEEYNATLEAQRQREHELERAFPEFECLLKILGLNPNIFEGY